MKKILVIAMFDSPHTARWLSQFKNNEANLIVFPAEKFRKTHYMLRDLFIESKNIRSGNRFCNIQIEGIFDFVLEKIFIFRWFKFDRKNRLQKIIRKYNFDLVHLMELSKAGVLYEEISSLNLKSHRILISNWGSELMLAKHEVRYLEQIKSLLKKASFFTAECERDYLLANEYGFEGEYLAKIPAGGGFLFDFDITKCSSRKNIIVKGYGGNLGRADISLKVVEKLLTVFENTTAFVYSCTPDVLPMLNSIKHKFGNRIQFSTTRQVISREEILSIFNKSRLYIGCSRADGLSTSFIEALATGTYPIQTNTSCASELIELGFMGSITEISETEIYDESVKALTDDSWVDKVTLENYNLAIKYFEYTNIQKIALTFYEK
jgi:hypothetical protein